MNASRALPSRLFDRDAAGYDDLRRALIPCFDAFYGTALAVIGQWHAGGAIKVLDLGAGPGLLSSMIRTRFPCAQLCLLDGSEAMLTEARRRFDGIDSVRYRVGDMDTTDLGGPWDLIVSALAIHHLEHEAKRGLFGRILQALVPGGLFMNAEQVLGPLRGDSSSSTRRLMASSPFNTRP